MESKIIALVGSPGSGKTYLAKKLKEYYNAQIIYEIPNEGFPEKIKQNLLTQTNFFENQVWFRNLQVRNHNKAVELSNQGYLAILDTPFYQNQLYVEYFITDELQKDILKEIGKWDFENISQPDITIYIKTTKESIKQFLEQRKNKTDFENDSWREFIIGINPHIEEYMQKIKQNIPNLIEIERELWDFDKTEDFEKLIKIIEEFN